MSTYSPAIKKYSVLAFKKRTVRNGPDKSIRTKCGVAQQLENGTIMLMMNVWPIGTDQLWLEPEDSKGHSEEEVIPDPVEG